MTPRQFEAQYAPLWAELDALLRQAEGEGPALRRPRGQRPPPRRPRGQPAFDGARLSALYRRCCEHLALAQARAYPVAITHRLEGLTQRAHQAIYRTRDGGGLARLRQRVLVDIPEAVRAQGVYVLIATLLFAGPLLALGLACYVQPDFILHLVDPGTVSNFDAMYGPGTRALGHARDSDTDWQMFGFYILNNIGIGFQCFASGLFFGLGSIFYLAYNGAFIGGIAGYITQRGYLENFYSFVVTHGAFELTAIVLSGAAGLRLGHALLSPGRHTRAEALRLAARESIVVMYGVFGMLFIAAGIEAFWSSSRWVPPLVKYGVGAVCWVLVFAYLGLQGRPRAEPPAERSPDAR